MKMVHGNAIFIREKAKQARNSHRYTFSTRSFTSLNSFNFPEDKAKYKMGCKKLFPYVIMTWRYMGRYPQKLVPMWH